MKFLIKKPTSLIVKCFIDIVITSTICFLYLLLASVLITENKRYIEKENGICATGYDYVKFNTQSEKLLAIQDTFCIYHDADLDTNKVSECLSMNKIFIKPLVLFTYYFTTIICFAIFLHTLHLIIIYDSNTKIKKLIRLFLSVLVIVLAYLLAKEIAFYYFFRGCIVTGHASVSSYIFLELVAAKTISKLYQNKKYIPVFLILIMYYPIFVSLLNEIFQ